MNTPIEQLIQLAITEANAGNKAGARKLLSQAAKDNPQNPKVWYALSQMVDDEENSIYCLEKALEIEPNNTEIRLELELRKPVTAKSEKIDSDESRLKTLGIEIEGGQLPVVQKPILSPVQPTQTISAEKESAAVSERIKTIRCHYCAEDNFDDVRYCGYCGRELIEKVQQEIPKQNTKKMSILENAFESKYLVTTILGLISASVMGLGSFLPLISLPIVGSINYFHNGNGDGVIVVILAIGAIVSIILRKYWISGLFSIISGFMVGNLMLDMSNMIQELSGTLTEDLEGNPFAGLAEVFMESVQIGVGAYIIATGAGLLLIASIWGITLARQQ